MISFIRKHRSALPLVSIVVPVYNTEEYLEECIDSIVDQSYDNLEIILINDGSTDDSLRIINDYAMRDRRVKVFSQENKGLGQTRNVGISLATGKYIIFWDSDDSFHEEAISKLVTKAEETDADVCVCNAQTVDAQTGKNKPAEFIRKKYPEKDPFSWRDYPDEIFLASTVAWNKFVRLDFLKDEKILFPDGIYEDFIYTTLLMRLAKRITIIRDRLIYYKVNRVGSITFDADAKAEKRIASHMDTYKELKKRGLLSDKKIVESFFNKLAIDYRFFIRFFNDYPDYEVFYQQLTSEMSAFSFFDREKYNVPSVNEFLDYDAEGYLFLEFKKQLADAARYRQLGIDRGKKIRELQKKINE